MTILAYLLVPVLVVAIAASLTWARNRQPTSLQSGVDSFRREMDALSPDAAPLHRRRTEPTGPGDTGPRGRPGAASSSRPTGPPRRPPTPDPRP